MKVQLLKNLIKEAVREVLKEELKEILLETRSSSSTVVEPSSMKDYSVFPSVVKIDTDSSYSPYTSLQDVLNETKQSMTRSDYSNIIGENKKVSTSEPFSLINESSNVGLDISNLDFVKKAAAVYNLSTQKQN